MYIRLKRHKSKAKKKEFRPFNGDSIAAVLVKSERVNGLPRQKVLAHLATIQERFIKEQPWTCNWFYFSVTERLKDYGLTEDEITLLVAKLEKHIPRYTDSQIKDELAKVQYRRSA